MRWHFHLSPPAAGAVNMAFDEALMRRVVRTGDAVFRLYSWDGPTLSLGRNQRARGCYDLTAAQARGITFVRRPTGGRALLHHREVTYSATLPATDVRDAAAAYELINDVLIEGLAALGVAACRAERSSGPVAVAPGLRPCFDLPSAREITVRGRKLVGSAQWRRNGALLQHGSILVHDDQPLIARITSGDIPSQTRAADLAGILARTPSFHEVALPILEALSRRTTARLEPLRADQRLETDCEELRQLYDDDRWTWRR